MQENITVEGEVQYPGTYAVKPNETVVDLLKRAEVRLQKPL